MMIVPSLTKCSSVAERCGAMAERMTRSGFLLPEPEFCANISSNTKPYPFQVGSPTSHVSPEKPETRALTERRNKWSLPDIVP
jgi:hypothetical protein